MFTPQPLQGAGQYPPQHHQQQQQQHQQQQQQQYYGGGDGSGSGGGGAHDDGSGSSKSRGSARFFWMAWLGFLVYTDVVSPWLELRDDGERAREVGGGDGVRVVTVDMGAGGPGGKSRTQDVIVRVKGRGSPTVVIDSGTMHAGKPLQDVVSKFTRTISFDHAGARFSSLPAAHGDTFRGPQVVARETAALLNKLQVDDDIVVVGQGAGWASGTVLAGKNSAGVRALVLVDPMPLLPLTDDVVGAMREKFNNGAMSRFYAEALLRGASASNTSLTKSHPFSWAHHMIASATWNKRYAAAKAEMTSLAQWTQHSSAFPANGYAAVTAQPFPVSVLVSHPTSSTEVFRVGGDGKMVDAVVQGIPNSGVEASKAKEQFWGSILPRGRIDVTLKRVHMATLATADAQDVAVEVKRLVMRARQLAADARV